MIRRSVFLALVLCLGIVPGPPRVCAQQNETFRSWNQPVEPFRIAGNLYYVGANDITAYLITTSEGHILIDGGFPETAPLIRSAVETLGFAIGEVKILLNSHAHFDHIGGLAQLREWSGAEVRIAERDAELVESGGVGDFFLDDPDTRFPAVEVDRRLADGDTVELGGTTLTAHVTAGHTKGCTTWTLTVEEGDELYRVVSVCSVSVLPGLDLVANPAYPEIAADYARSFETLEGLPCDIFLASHGRFFDLDGKRRRLAAGESGAEVMVDPQGYRDYVARGKARFEEILAEQRAVAPDGEP